MINEVIALVLTKWSLIICERVKNKWSTIDIPISNDEHINHTTTTIIGNLVTSTIEANGFGAFIKEFGRGSLGDHKHEYWDEYKGSEHFNPTRESTLLKRADMARVNGEHSYPIQAWGKNPNGFPAGFDMELEYWVNQHDDRFRPIEAMHIIQQEVTFALPEIAEDISNEMTKATADMLATQLTGKLYI